MTSHLIARCVAAFEAFRDAPAREYLIVERVGPLGWCILHQVEDYDAAYAFRFERHQGNRHVRVMTRTEWQRRTLALMSTREPWLALSKLNAEVVNAQKDLKDEKAIARAAILDAYAEAKHP